MIVDLTKIAPAKRAAVERALAVRHRVDDGHAPSETLREMLDHSDRFTARAVAKVGTRRRYGLLMNWPGLDEPQFFPVPKDLWDCLELTIDPVERVFDTR